MFIEKISHYIPEERVPNSYFKDVNGLDDEWIFQRTGIKTRSRAAEHENSNTMAVEAVRSLEKYLDGVDLIVGASYSPYDTVATIAHVVQKEFALKGAKAVVISSACSSLINAVEIVEGYFAMGKASKALVIASEHNWLYSNQTDEKSGHLWGDGATAILLNSSEVPGSPEILNIFTEGLGDVGQGPDAVFLRPAGEGLEMPNGRDVFIHACEYMETGLMKVLDNRNLDKKDLDYIIPHQANDRIIQNLSQRMKFDYNRIFRNIDRLGNTGCASTGICLSENWQEFKKGDLVGITVFGGGYSYGAMLIEF
ncbi:3-oxoacyl-ACP synthase III family protein [Saccharicrinis sp. FJH62]|uniref:3-oxoacyl-ACP synthase III family protein n=1 Tax=Saccharicrinis sp. FJH62 TaxID=3344657 RepID=UPI0035D4A452